MLEELNKRFAIDDRINFRPHASGLIQACIDSPLCHASVFLLGAHVTEFQSVGCEPLLFLSGSSAFQEGVAIRGGVPICFPWFGPHPTDAAAPAHGLARTAIWEVLSTSASEDKVSMSLGQVLDEWQLEYVVKFSQSLDLSLAIVNASNSRRSCEVALHTYFSLADVRAARVCGLEKQAYFDKLTRENVAASGQPLHFTQETDRVYVGEAAEITLEDASARRQILIRPRNSQSTVVWNPWIEKSRRMPDFGDDEYLRMCCIETANVAAQQIALKPGERFELGVNIASLPTKAFAE